MSRLTVSTSAGSRSVQIQGDKVTIGKAPSNDVAIDDDTTVSRLHAVLERYPGGWVVRDLGSRNGTFLNGKRLMGESALRPGDEIRCGSTRILFREAEQAAPMTATEGPKQAPDLTPREREVLIGLCQPLLTGDAFSEPATVSAIAEDLFVTKAAVKQHLGRLYDKFDIHDDTTPRRVQLANEALARGAVSLADLRSNTDG